MTGDWRRLALAAVAAMVMAAVAAAPVTAQAPAKAGAKKAPAKEADGDAQGEAKPKRQDPEEAQRAIDAAVKVLEAGKPAEAEHALTGVIAGGGLPPPVMAKALLYRGIAYRQQKKPALAIADLTSALWLKGGLGEEDRADALKQRAAAYEEAGLADSGGPIAPAAPSAARGARTTSAGGRSPEAAQAPQPPSSGWPNPFAGWFGGSSPAPSSPPQQPAPSTTASVGSPQAQAAPQLGTRVSEWTRQTEVRGGRGPAGDSAATAKAEGRFRIQIGMVRTEAEAAALSARLKREHPDALAQREAEIDEAVVGNMGSFYRVRVGPFASAQDGQAACAKLKGSGFDCLVVAP
jgi:cell division protein FtsN